MTAARGSPDGLTVRRRVIRAVAAAAAAEVPGVVRVGRGGPPPLAWLVGRPVAAWSEAGRIHVRLWLIVRPGESLPALSRRTRAAVGRAIERQLGLELGEVTVLIDGIGA